MDGPAVVSWEDERRVRASGMSGVGDVDETAMGDSEGAADMMVGATKRCYNMSE